jgi:hypothetical protein
VAVALHELQCLGSALTAESDIGMVGGVDDDTKKIGSFADVENEAVQLVAEEAGDVGTFFVLVVGDDMAGDNADQSQLVNGQTPVAYSPTYKRIHRVRASNFNQSNGWCIESQTPITTGTAQGGTATTIQLDAGAPTLARGDVIRLTGGTAAGKIRSIIEWDDGTKTAIVKDWEAGPPDATTTYTVAKGLVTSFTIVEVRRLFVNVPTPPAAGAQVKYYDKMHFRNDGGDLFTGVQLSLVDPSGKVKFGVAADGINDSATIANRLTAPAGVTFDTVPVALPNLDGGDAIGIWVELTRDPGDPEIDDEILQWELEGT